MVVDRGPGYGNVVRACKDSRSTATSVPVYIWRTDLAASGLSFLTAEFSALAWCTSADASSDVVSCLLMHNCMQREHEQLGRRYGDSGQEERVLMHNASTKEVPDSG
jgi:hypothetical protein